MEDSSSSIAGSASRALPARATIAVIGAGIVGNCLVEHLAELGWEDLLLIDKGPLPNPGGSTGHASNFIFPTDHNREIAMLTLESQRQYAALGVNTTCGGIEVARTEARREELRRRMTSARAWGIETELLTPIEVVAKAPFVNGDVILGGFYTPSVSVVDSVRAGAIMRERAQRRGVLTVLDNTEVTGLEVSRPPFGRPRIRAVVTAGGAIEVEQVVIACGVWSPRLAALAGATIPLTPAVHQMAPPAQDGKRDGCGSSSSVAQGLLRAARQELLDPSKAWWGGRRGRFADRRCCPLSVSLGVVPLVLACFVEVPVRIEVAAGS